MDYNLKIVIAGEELLEFHDTTEGDTKEPSITDVTLVNNACAKPMEIGATASDRLTFTIINPDRNIYDGDVVAFFIQETESLQRSKATEIEEAVGSETTNEFIFPDDTQITEEDSEDEEAIDAEDEEDAAETVEALDTGLDLNLEGEFEEETTETLPDGEVSNEWRQVGLYYVFSQVNNSDSSIKVVCYDGFSKMSGTFIPTASTATIADMYEDLQTQALENCGITIGDEDFGDISDTRISVAFRCSYRELMGYFAGLRGGYAEFDQSGECGISQYVFDDNNLIDSELISYNETSSGEMVVESIACNITRNALSDDYLESGSGGQDIVFTNPFMTQDILDDIFSGYQGMRFIGAVTSVNWDDRMTAGEFARIFTEEEYANYLKVKNNLEQNAGTLTPEEISELRAGMNQLGKVILISSQTIDFKGDAVTTITSVCESETSKANPQVTAAEAKFMQVYEDNLDTRELADQARQYAEQAQEEARTASESAQQATASAIMANSAASSAQASLGDIEKVVDALNWIAEHGEIEQTEDRAVIDGKFYFDANKTQVTPTPNPHLQGYYELATAAWTVSTDEMVDLSKKYFIRHGSGTAADPYYYELVDPSGEEDPSEEGWYELSADTYQISSDTSVVEHKLYFSPVPAHYELTSDTEVVSDKTYYTRSSAEPYTYTAVTPAGGENPAASGWYEYVSITYDVIKDYVADPYALGLYELDRVDASISNYVASHVSLDGDGLVIQTDGIRSKVRIDGLGVHLINETGDTIATFSEDITLGDVNGINVTLSPANGLQFKNGSVPVSYINSSTMMITQAEVTDSLRIGEFLWAVQEHRISLIYNP